MSSPAPVTHGARTRAEDFAVELDVLDLSTIRDEQARALHHPPPAMTSLSSEMASPFPLSVSIQDLPDIFENGWGSSGDRPADSFETTQSSLHMSLSTKNKGAQSESGVIQNTNLPSFQMLSFDSSNLKEQASFDSAPSRNSVEEVMRALINQPGGNDIKRTIAMISASRNTRGKFDAPRRIVDWLKNAATFIVSQPTPAARRSAFDNFRRQWNELQNEKSIFLAKKLVEMFRVDMRGLSRNNPVHIGRVVLEVKHWQSRMDHLFIGLYVVARARQLPDVACMQLLTFLMESAPEADIGTFWERDDSIPDLDVYANASDAVKAAERTIQVNNEKFSGLMSLRMLNWLGLPAPFSFESAINTVPVDDEDGAGEFNMSLELGGDMFSFNFEDPILVTDVLAFDDQFAMEIG
jgi:hypothetical protein